MTQTYSRRVATNMVVANMIGTGIFTSIGFQVLPGAIPDPFAILLIWLLGGVLSIFGATAYAEIATHFQESGGEYVYLSKLYHPVLGLASGWVSLVVGFSAASASLGLAAGEYLASALGPYLSGWLLPVEKLVAMVFVGIAVAVQFGGVQKGWKGSELADGRQIIVHCFAHCIALSNPARGHEKRCFFCAFQAFMEHDF